MYCTCKTNGSQTLVKFFLQNLQEGETGGNNSPPAQNMPGVMPVVPEKKIEAKWGETFCSITMRLTWISVF